MLQFKGDVDVLVIMYQGVIDGVEVYFDELEALQAFERETGMLWPEYLRRTKTEDIEAVLGGVAGTRLYVTEVRGELGTRLE